MIWIFDDQALTWFKEHQPSTSKVDKLRIQHESVETEHSFLRNKAQLCNIAIVILLASAKCRHCDLSGIRQSILLRCSDKSRGIFLSARPIRRRKESCNLKIWMQVPVLCCNRNLIQICICRLTLKLVVKISFTTCHYNTTVRLQHTEVL